MRINRNWYRMATQIKKHVCFFFFFFFYVAFMKTWYVWIGCQWRADNDLNYVMCMLVWSGCQKLAIDVSMIGRVLDRGRAAVCVMCYVLCVSMVCNNINFLVDWSNSIICVDTTSSSEIDAYFKQIFLSYTHTAHSIQIHFMSESYWCMTNSSWAYETHSNSLSLSHTLPFNPFFFCVYFPLIW